MQASRKLDFYEFHEFVKIVWRDEKQTRQTKSSNWKELTSLMLVFYVFFSFFLHLWWEWSLIQTKSQFQFLQTTWTFLANCYFGFSNWFMSFVVNVHKVIVCTHTKFQWRIPMQNSHRTAQTIPTQRFNCRPKTALKLSNHTWISAKNQMNSSVLYAPHANKIRFVWSLQTARTLQICTQKRNLLRIKSIIMVLWKQLRTCLLSFFGVNRMQWQSKYFL